MVLTVEAYNRPPIWLLDENGQKIRLRLRRMSFVTEIKGMKFPVEILEQHNLLVSDLLFDRNEKIYTAVARWHNLTSKHPGFWTSLGFRSEDEYLAFYNLPDGVTLGGWVIMINLFNKQTFILLGDTVLFYMMRAIGEYQKDPEKRKKDYQAIFDRYCDVFQSFDKAAFYDVVRLYVESMYERPSATQEGLDLDKWRREKAKQQKKKSQKKERKIVNVEIETPTGKKTVKDFVWENRTCPYCREKEVVIETFKDYVSLLEKIILQNLGKDGLPQRPDILDELF